LNNGGSVYLVGYTGSEIRVVLPSGFEGKNYTVHSNAFIGNRVIEELYISSRVNAIHALAFKGCDNLASVEFEDAEGWYETLNADYYRKKSGGTPCEISNTATFVQKFKSIYLYK
jgi:hypothetical protein